MAREYGSRPSEFYGLADPGIAIDFDKACFRRLQLFDCEVEQRKIDALNSHHNGAPPQSGNADELGRIIPESILNN
jgi:hypothetical protein